MRLTWTENAGPEGCGFSKAKVRCKPCFEGKPAQVSTVRTKKLVFSLNYERLGNRPNVAGTGTSLCRLIGMEDWIADCAQMMEEVE